MFHITCTRIVLFLSSLMYAVDAQQCSIPKYRVIAVPSPGLLNVEANSTGTFYTGFTVDLLYAVARVANFTFDLTAQANSNFGASNTGSGTNSGCLAGGIGELQAQMFDFYVGLFPITYNYAKSIDFTVPIIRVNYQVIYNSYTGLDKSNYMVLANGALLEFLQESKDPKLMAIYSNILSHQPDSLPTTYPQAVAMVKSGGWAFFDRTPSVDLPTCDSYSYIVKDPYIYGHTYTGWAVQKGSNLLNTLNLALLQLQENGVVADLLKRWFPCSDFTCA